MSLVQDQRRRSYFEMASVSAIYRAVFRLCPAAKENTKSIVQNLARHSNSMIAAHVILRERSSIRQARAATLHQLLL